MSTRAEDVFFSYNARDAGAIREIKDVLTRDFGIEAWMDASIEEGKPWEEEISKALNRIRVVAVFLGPSGWGTQHFQQAATCLKRARREPDFHVLPVRLPGAHPDEMYKLEDLFVKRQRVDFGEQFDKAAIERLAVAIRRQQERRREPPPAVEQQPEPPPAVEQRQEPPPAVEQRAEPVQAPDRPAPVLQQVVQTLAPSPVTATPVQVARRALSDRDTEADLLGFKDYVDALAELIQSPHTERPLTIAIDGPWGVGKTSLMRMLKERLDPKGARKVAGSLRTVWFNAWKYDKEESLWAALTLEILSQVKERCGLLKRLRLGLALNSKRLDAGRLLGAFIKPVVISAAVIGGLWIASALEKQADSLVQRIKDYAATIGMVGVVAGFLSFLKVVVDRVKLPFELKLSDYMEKPDYEGKIGFIADFERDFERVISVVTEQGKWPLVVFIDDLDRCKPPKPVEVIEAINLLLDAKHCIFVIGMDTRSVAASVEAKYEKLKAPLESDRASRLTVGQQFLEKIVQLQFHIPQPPANALERFVTQTIAGPAPAPAKLEQPSKELLAEQAIRAERRVGKDFDEALKAVQKQDVLPAEVVVDAVKSVERKEAKEDEAISTAIGATLPFLSSNPRKIKRFINAFRLVAVIANNRQLIERGSIRLELLAKVMCLNMRWPDVLPLLSEGWKFAARLEQAHELRQKQRRGVALSGADAAALAGLLQDPVLERHVDSEPLLMLLEQLARALSTEELSRYIHLTEPAGSPKPAPRGP